MRKRSRSTWLVSILVATGCASSPDSGGQTAKGSIAGTGNSTSGAGGLPVPGPGGGTGTSGAGSSGVDSSSGGGGATGSPSTISGAMVGATGSAASGASSGTASSGSATASGASSGSASAGGADGGTNHAGPFTCNLALGMFTTGQWFSGTNPGGASTPFIKFAGVDTTKWEGKTQKYSFIEKWANPTDPVWSIPMVNACAQNSTAPDRIVFVGHHEPWETTQMGWEMLLNSTIATIKAKYPSVKEIDILTMGRAPNNVQCANNNDKYTIISPAEEAAYQAVADASGGLVKVGPKYFVPDCNNSYIFANDTDYTTSASNALAMQLATYYIVHP
jgi:hypothetical protein